MQNSKLQALAEQYGISEDEVVEGLLGMQGIIADNPKLARLFEIANNPEADDDMKSELEMALGGYNDKLNSQTENYNNSLKDFDGIVLALAQKLYPNATPEMLIENLSKVTAPEGAENFGNVERFMGALGMFEQGDGGMQQVQDSVEQALQETGAENSSQTLMQAKPEKMQNIDEIALEKATFKTDEDSNLYGQDKLNSLIKLANRK